MQEPEILMCGEKKLVGMQIYTSLAEDDTVAMWQRFMPRRKEIRNSIGQLFYSVQVFDGGLDVEEFTPKTEFEKWAAVEVSDFNAIPDGMATFILPAGLYAVFIYKGASSAFYEAAQYIYGFWLPESVYELDARPHFDVMGEKYLGPNNPDSEEEIWIPVKLR
ncbi:GyrI-like domain-containing protein [Pontibacter sp. KCTC 32443]|uniref:GyrI-like domain-containing protein n=1 Tax=Pontibacter TaxID=323449 RepID=UPI00164EC418|nr:MULTISPECIES: GyrI-like domain-containing protein [Pontibacter]MBC5774245.1 GyrI-like domain-containing protein [Pontibacter sp. KCTC 32443]